MTRVFHRYKTDAGDRDIFGPVHSAAEDAWIVRLLVSPS
jgi:hypothetical protein